MRQVVVKQEKIRGSNTENRGISRLYFDDGGNRRKRIGSKKSGKEAEDKHAPPCSPLLLPPLFPTLIIIVNLNPIPPCCSVWFPPKTLSSFYCIKQNLSTSNFCTDPIHHPYISSITQT